MKRGFLKANLNLTLELHKEAFIDNGYDIITIEGLKKIIHGKKWL